jgi:hypothetical protein
MHVDKGGGVMCHHVTMLQGFIPMAPAVECSSTFSRACALVLSQGGAGGVLAWPSPLFLLACPPCRFPLRRACALVLAESGGDGVLARPSPLFMSADDGVLARWGSGVLTLPSPLFLPACPPRGCPLRPRACDLDPPRSRALVRRLDFAPVAITRRACSHPDACAGGPQENVENVLLGDSLAAHS